MIQVEVWRGNLEAALKMFSKAIARDGVHRENKIRTRFVSKSDRKKYKAQAAERRRKKYLRLREQRRQEREREWAMK
jgi:ribosomal protein S21